jgi:hypothetical protein
MMFDKQALLISRLFKATKEQKVDWRPSVRDDSFQVSFPNYTVILYTVGADYVVDLTNDAGDIVDTFNDVQLDKTGIFPDLPNFMGWYQAMSDLYGLARRSALGADKALDDILKALPD